MFDIDPATLTRNDSYDALLQVVGLLQTAMAAGAHWPNIAKLCAQRATSGRELDKELKAYDHALQTLANALEGSAAVVGALTDRAVREPGSPPSDPVNKALAAARQVSKQSSELLADVWRQEATSSLPPGADRARFERNLFGTLDAVKEYLKQATNPETHASEQLDNLRRGTAALAAMLTGIERSLAKVAPEDRDLNRQANPLRGYRDQISALLEQFEAEMLERTALPPPADPLSAESGRG